MQRPSLQAMLKPYDCMQNAQQSCDHSPSTRHEGVKMPEKYTKLLDILLMAGAGVLIAISAWLGKAKRLNAKPTTREKFLTSAVLGVSAWAIMLDYCRDSVGIPLGAGMLTAFFSGILIPAIERMLRYSEAALEVKISSKAGVKNEDVIAMLRENKQDEKS